MQKTRKMIPPRKVKVLESEYIEKSDLMKWTLHFLDDGLDQTYVWPSSDLLNALNIKGKATPDILHKFCSEIKGKTINFSIDEQPESPEVSITKEEYDLLGKGISEHFELFKKTVEKDKE